MFLYKGHPWGIYKTIKVWNQFGNDKKGNRKLDQQNMHILTYDRLGIDIDKDKTLFS